MQVDPLVQDRFVGEAAEEDTLIVMSPFYVTEGKRATDAHNEIRWAIEQQAKALFCLGGIHE